KPFEYLLLNGKLTLYVRRDCTDQLRKVHGVSITSLKREVSANTCIVEAEVRDATGRTDAATGVVSVRGLADLDFANALMRCETKAKRRATLSICGLGMLDESELDTVADYKL